MLWPYMSKSMELAAAGSIPYAGDQFLQTMDRTSSLYDGHHIGLGSQARAIPWLSLKAKFCPISRHAAPFARLSRGRLPAARGGSSFR